MDLCPATKRLIRRPTKLGLNLPSLFLSHLSKLLGSLSSGYHPLDSLPGVFAFFRGLLLALVLCFYDPVEEVMIGQEALQWMHPGQVIIGDYAVPIRQEQRTARPEALCDAGYEIQGPRRRYRPDLQ